MTEERKNRGEEMRMNNTQAIEMILLGAVVAIVLFLVVASTPHISLAEKYVYGTVVRVEKGITYDKWACYLYTIKLNTTGATQFIDQNANLQRFHIGDKVELAHWCSVLNAYRDAELVDVIDDC